MYFDMPEIVNIGSALTELLKNNKVGVLGDIVYIQ